MLVKSACLVALLFATAISVEEKTGPQIRVHYNITCPIVTRSGFYYHVWLLSRPEEYSVLDVTNGMTSGYEKGQLKGTMPDRYPSDIRVSVFVKHNCDSKGNFIYTPEEELGVCHLYDTYCSFYYHRNLLEDMPQL